MRSTVQYLHVQHALYSERHKPLQRQRHRRRHRPRPRPIHPLPPFCPWGPPAPSAAEGAAPGPLRAPRSPGHAAVPSPPALGTPPAQPWGPLGFEIGAERLCLQR